MEKPDWLFELPDGRQGIKEGKAEILFDDKVFYNRIQEFNRDMSIAAIRVWSEMFLASNYKKATKKEAPIREAVGCDVSVNSEDKKVRKQQQKHKEILEMVTSKFNDSKYASIDIENECFDEYSFNILEALSASGLRSIRYAKEIPRVKRILANDVLPAAVEAIQRNAAHNGVDGLVVPFEGDAIHTLYNVLGGKISYQVIDLDPYGSAAPFLDGAVQAISNGGLLGVTCTDMAVLAGGNPDVCFGKYGGINIPNAPFTHELALRILLHSLQSIASRYKKVIEPVLCCSIDYYIRVFVRVRHSPINMKLAATKTAFVHYCPKCKSYEIQNIGKTVKTEKGTKNGPASVSVGAGCKICDGVYQIGGPFYSAPIHDDEFVSRMLGHCSSNYKSYGTWERMLGMLSVISEERSEPLYMVLPKMCGVLHCSTPSLPAFTSAVLSAGFEMSQTHCMQQGIKTNAPISVLWDILRNWCREHEPGKYEKESKLSPAYLILSKEPEISANFDIVNEAIPDSSRFKLTRFQENPTDNWGPQSKPGKARKSTMPKSKRKAVEQPQDNKKLKME